MGDDHTQGRRGLEIPAATVRGWQEVVDILAEILEIPAALIMRLDDPDIEVFVASAGGTNPYSPGDREHFWGSGLYCETVVKTEDRLLVPDALADADWRRNPDIRLGMVSYLGFPIRLPDGTPFGTICVLDRKRNTYSQRFERLMQKFRQLVEADLETLYVNRELGDRNRRLGDYLTELRALRGLVPICASCKSIRDGSGVWRPAEHYLGGHPDTELSHHICPTCMPKLYPDWRR